MKIALTITELHPGGAEKCCVQLARHLHQRGHQIEIWQLWPTPPAGKRQLIEQLDQCQIPWHSGMAQRARDFPRTCRWLREQWQAFEPDVVQSFLFHANLAAAIALRDAPALFFGGARVKQPEWVRQRLQKFAAKRMTKLICVSQDVAEHCRVQERIASERLMVIPNGVSLDPSSLEEISDWSHFGLPANARVLLFVGRLTQQKGILNFLQHADKCLAELPEHHIVLMGDGDQRQQVQASIGRSAHADRIHWLGWQADPRSWMRRAECLLLPAVYEGMPNVVLEAMAEGIAVITFAVEGIQELLGENEAARHQVAACGDYPQFLHRLMELAKNPSLRKMCGQSNLSRAGSLFRLEDQLSRYEQVYLQSLQQENA